MATESPIGIGLMCLTFGFIAGFVGFAGWKDPENFAVMSSWIMHEADSDNQQAYGKLVAVCIGCTGVAGMLFGLYLFLTPFLK